MLAAKEAGQSVVVIAGKISSDPQHAVMQSNNTPGMGNKLWPSKPPHYYNVLDHFHVTDAWPIKSVGTNNEEHTQFMVRLEKVNTTSTSWWEPISESRDKYAVGEYVCPVKVCQACGKPSKEIYENGWACLESSCSEFFKFDLPEGEAKVSLKYTTNFLRERSTFRSEIPLCPLVPPLPSSIDNNGIGTGKASRNGIVCPECRRCSRRLKWDAWECETDGCTFRHILPFSTMTVQDIEQEAASFKGREWFNSDLILKDTTIIDGHKAEIYYLKGEEDTEVAGIVTILRASRGACEKPQGPDEIFEELQKADIGLRRNVALHAGKYT